MSKKTGQHTCIVAPEYCVPCLQATIAKLEEELASLEKQIQYLCDENQKAEGKKGFCCCGECPVNEDELSEIAELQAKVERLKAENEWVSVEDRLPERDSKIVLAYIKYGPAIMRCGKTLTMRHELWEYVTHWKPINPPEEE